MGTRADPNQRYEQHKLGPIKKMQADAEFTGPVLSTLNETSYMDEEDCAKEAHYNSAFKGGGFLAAGPNGYNNFVGKPAYTNKSLDHFFTNQEKFVKELAFPCC